MATIKDCAICIRRWDFSETSQTVSLLTRSHGTLRGLAKGAKREKGDFSGGLDVLSRGQVVAICKPGRDLATLTQWHHEQTYSVLRTHLAANRAAWLMADQVQHMIGPQDPHPAVYDQMAETLGRFAPDRPPGPDLLRFQWVLLQETGYQPELVQDAQTGEPLLEEGETLAFHPRAGGVVNDTGARDRWRVRTETVQLLRRLSSDQTLGDVDQLVLDRANRLLAAYVREIIGSEPASMRWAFGGTDPAPGV